MADQTPWAQPPTPPPPPLGLPPPLGVPPTPAPPDLPSPPAGQTPPAPDVAGVGVGDPLDDTRPEPGSLHLRGGRAWKTWQLVVAVIVAAVVGM